MSADRRKAHELFHAVRRKVLRREEWIDDYVRYLNLLELDHVWKRQRVNLINLMKTVYRVLGPQEGCFASKLAETRGLIDPRKRGYLFYYTNRHLRYTSPCLERRFMKWRGPLYAYELLDKVARGERSPYLFLLFVEPYGEKFVHRVLSHRLFTLFLRLPSGKVIFYSYVDRKNVCRLVTILLEKYPKTFTTTKAQLLLELCGLLEYSDQSLNVLMEEKTKSARGGM